MDGDPLLSTCTGIKINASTRINAYLIQMPGMNVFENNKRPGVYTVHTIMMQLLCMKLHTACTETWSYLLCTFETLTQLESHKVDGAPLAHILSDFFAEQANCLATDDDSGELLPRDEFVQVCFGGVWDFVPPTSWWLPCLPMHSSDVCQPCCAKVLPPQKHTCHPGRNRMNCTVCAFTWDSLKFL